MGLPSFFVLLVYAAGYLMLAFAAVCLACGLYYFADLAEEYTVFTQQIIRWTIAVELLLHVALLVFERFPLFPTSLGMAAHVLYFLLLRRFPFVNVMSILFIAACTLFIVSLVAWFLFFSANHELFHANHLTPGYSVAFFYVTMVFLVPTALFVGLTVSESQLPGAQQQQQPSPSKHFSAHPSSTATGRSGGGTGDVSGGGGGVQHRFGGGGGVDGGDEVSDGLGQPASLHKKRRNLLSSVAHLATYYAARTAEFLPGSRQRRRARGNIL